MHRPSSIRGREHLRQGVIPQQQMVSQSGSDVRRHANDQGVAEVPVYVDECMEQPIVVRDQVRQGE